MAIDFSIREFAHPLTILRLHRTLEKTQWLPPTELEEYQNSRLRAVVTHAYENVPYYTSLFDSHGVRPSDIKTGKDLLRLPILDKQTVRETAGKLHARHAGKYHPHRYTTSGTTGRPLPFLLDRYANSLEFVMYWRHWSWAGYRLGDSFAELGTVHFLNRPDLAEHRSHWQPLLRRLMLNGNQLSTSNAGEMARSVRRRKPRFLKGMASTLYFFARCLDESNIRDISFKAVFSNGEVMTPEFRKKIEETFHAPVLDLYAHMERTVAISQCLEGGYHINSDYGLLELLPDNDRQINGHRRGRVVGTSLYNLAMPLIRYDVGDEVELEKPSITCPCGRSLPLAKAIHGRTEDVIVTPDGRYLTAIFILAECVEGVGFAQFIQEEPDSVVINVVPTSGWSSHEQVRLKRYASRLLGETVRVSVRAVEVAEIVTDSTGKRPVVISSTGHV